MTTLRAHHRTGGLAFACTPGKRKPTDVHQGRDERAPAPAIVGLARRGASVHVRSPRPRPPGSNHGPPQSPASPAGEHPSTPAVPGLARRGAPVHVRSPRPRPKGSDHRRPQSPASPEGLSSPGVERPPMTARERACGDRGPTTVISARQGRRLRTSVVAPLRARQGTADVDGCSPSGEAGDCGRGRVLPDGRGRGLRTSVLAPRRARPTIADVDGCSPTGEAGDRGRALVARGPLPTGRHDGLPEAPPGAPAFACPGCRHGTRPTPVREGSSPDHLRRVEGLQARAPWVACRGAMRAREGIQRPASGASIGHESRGAR
ncbi:MAG: hypothetical protein JWM10_3041 [Myxococcaceae bacterium]|nr:hypothetical protein [Myxococcaceae bacterium]